MTTPGGGALTTDFELMASVAGKSLILSTDVWPDTLPAIVWDGSEFVAVWERANDHALMAIRIAADGTGCDRAFRTQATPLSDRTHLPDEPSAASSVETELVVFDVLHHDARVGAVIQQSHAGRPERDQPCALGLECGQSLFTHEPGSDPHVEMQPVLDDLRLGHALEVQARPHAGGVDARGRRPVIIVVVVVRWDDVPEHLAPEPGDALGFGAVEGDLELLDR